MNQLTFKFPFKTSYFENDFYVEVVRLKSNKFNLLKDNNLILIKHKNYA